MIKEYQLSEPIPLPEFTDILMDLADLIQAKVEVEMLSKKLDLPYTPTRLHWILQVAGIYNIPPELLRNEFKRAVKEYLEGT